jgi:hypothetical protein
MDCVHLNAKLHQSISNQMLLITCKSAIRLDQAQLTQCSIILVLDQENIILLTGARKQALLRHVQNKQRKHSFTILYKRQGAAANRPARKDAEHGWWRSRQPAAKS